MGLGGPSPRHSGERSWRQAGESAAFLPQIPSGFPLQCPPPDLLGPPVIIPPVPVFCILCSLFKGLPLSLERAEGNRVLLDIILRLTNPLLGLHHSWRMRLTSICTASAWILQPSLQLARAAVSKPTRWGPSVRPFESSARSVSPRVCSRAAVVLPRSARNGAFSPYRIAHLMTCASSRWYQGRNQGVMSKGS